jgi:protein phosphatase
VTASPSSARWTGKAGIRFFGDVHGCAAEFEALAENALERGLHLHSLGDLTDRGPDSPGCMRLACDLHDAGCLDLNPGNHCLRFARWHRGEEVPIKPKGLGLTLRQIEGATEGRMLAKRYFNLLMASPLWTRYGRIYAVHAALHPEMIGRDGPALKDADWNSDLLELALEGEMRPKHDPDRWALGRRSFNWLEQVPANVTVLVGHSVTSIEGPRQRRNAGGGRIVHLDTGLDRGGPLSYVDVPMSVIELIDEPAIAEFPPASDLEIRTMRSAKFPH